MYIPEIPPMIAGTPQQQLLALREYLIRTTRSIEEELSSMYDEIHTDEPPEPTEPELIRRKFTEYFNLYSTSPNTLLLQIDVGTDGYTPIGIVSVGWEGSTNAPTALISSFSVENDIAEVNVLFYGAIYAAQYDFKIDVLYQKETE